MTRPIGDNLTPLSYQILLALADEPRHGYGILKEMEGRFGLSSLPSTGSLYLALQRLEAGGLIEDSPERPHGADTRRRYYRITTRGLETAEDQSVRLAALLATAREKKLLAGGTA